MIELGAFQGGQYILLANRNGLEDFEQESTCQFGEPQDGRCSAPRPGDAPQTVFAEYMVYLSYPVFSENDREPLAPLTLRLNDAVGTPSFSPNGDGVQDSITLAFEAPDRGEALFFVDLNGDRDVTPDELVLTSPSKTVSTELTGTGRRFAVNSFQTVNIRLNSICGPVQHTFH